MQIQRLEMQGQIPCYLEMLANETLINIFQFLIDPKDYFSFSLVNHHFQELSRDPQAYTNVMVPSHIMETELRKLPLLKRMQLARTVERNLLIGSLRTIVKLDPIRSSIFDTDNFHRSLYTPEIFLKNHFIVAAEDKIYVYNMQTSERKSFVPFKTQGLLGVDIDKPLLVLFSQKEFSIYDFDSFKNNGKGLLKHVQGNLHHLNVQYRGHLYPGPVANTCNHWLAVAFEKHVLVIDCNCLHETKINFESTKQILFTDVHLILVSQDVLEIYDTSTWMPVYSYSSNIKIDSAKTHQNKIVLVFENIESLDGFFIAGAIIDWKTVSGGESIRFLRSSDPVRIRSIDFYCQNRIFSCSSSSICKWDPEQSEPIKKRRNKYEGQSSKPVKKRKIVHRKPKAIQVLGEHLLVNFQDKLLVVNQSLEVIAIHESENGNFMQMMGGYLVEEKVVGPWPLSKKIIYVYNLREAKE